MGVISAKLLKQFPGVMETEILMPDEIRVVAKFYDPGGSCAWYLMAYDHDQHLFYGMYKGEEDSISWFPHMDLEQFIGSTGQRLQQDHSFGEHTLEEVMLGEVQ